LKENLGQAAQLCRADRLEFSASHLNYALADIAALGLPTSDKAVLDEIFSRFCIGK
jgi:tRNA U34 5-carboxymethylaminomethyl modifying GTPase MnmE/TrmE